MGGHYASYHHNIIAHCESRVPRLGPRYTTLALDKGELVDIRNNVYYNYAGEGCYGGEAQKVNLVNNYYKPGPATKLFTGSKENVSIALPNPMCIRKIIREQIIKNGFRPGAGFMLVETVWKDIVT